MPVGTLDPVWMPIVAARGLVVLARDRHIRTKPAELALLREAGLRVVWLAGKRDLTNWGYLVRVVTNWDRIERELRDRGDGPWFLALGDAGMAEIKVRPGP